MAKSVRRELLQLANTLNPAKDDCSGHMISEKLDGGRCFWDGGSGRGVATMSVPWAGITDPETGEAKAKVKGTATGLWSRYGNPIMAPDWFLNQLPCCPLDGELWKGRGKFQDTMSTIRKDVPVDAEWKKVKYAVYSCPSWNNLFAAGEIKNQQMVRTIDPDACFDFLASRMDYIPDLDLHLQLNTFAEELAYLSDAIETQSDHVFLHQQTRLSMDIEEAAAQVEAYLSKVLEKGGEGVMIRNPNARWTPKRHKGLLKYKPYKDDEAMVVGFVAGEEGKTGNLLGRIGSLICQWKGKEFRLSGLTYEERELKDVCFKWAMNNPGQECRESGSGTWFFPGRKVTFKYRELSDDGIPKEARYHRIRENE